MWFCQNSEIIQKSLRRAQKKSFSFWKNQSLRFKQTARKNGRTKKTSYLFARKEQRTNRIQRNTSISLPLSSIQNVLWYSLQGANSRSQEIQGILGRFAWLFNEKLDFGLRMFSFIISQFLDKRRWKRIKKVLPKIQTTNEWTIPKRVDWPIEEFERSSIFQPVVSTFRWEDIHPFH